MFVAASFPMESMKPHRNAKDVLHLFNSNPMELVSVMQNVDPDQLNEVLSMLEGILNVSMKTLNETRANVTRKSLELADADAQAADATELFETVNVTRNKAIINVTDAEETVKSKKEKHILAKQELNDQLPSLVKEQEVLREVIGQLKHLGGCSSHSDCDSSSFCHKDGKCVDCTKCHFNDLAISGQCPVKCPVLCEDDPPTYPKCPMCKNQTYCNELQQVLTCESNLTKCVPHPRCKFEAQKWRTKLLEAFAAAHNKNKSATIDDFKWPALGNDLCNCLNDQHHCFIDQNCTSLFEGSKEENSFNETHQTDQCLNKFQCTPEQCSFIPRIRDHVPKSFLNAIIPQLQRFL